MRHIDFSGSVNVRPPDVCAPYTYPPFDCIRFSATTQCLTTLSTNHFSAEFPGSMAGKSNLVHNYNPYVYLEVPCVRMRPFQYRLEGGPLSILIPSCISSAFTFCSSLLLVFVVGSLFVATGSPKRCFRRLAWSSWGLFALGSRNFAPVSFVLLAGSPISSSAPAFALVSLSINGRSFTSLPASPTRYLNLRHICCHSYDLVYQRTAIYLVAIPPIPFSFGPYALAPHNHIKKALPVLKIYELHRLHVACSSMQYSKNSFRPPRTC